MESKEVKAGIGYTIGNILVQGVTFISVPVFSRLMSSSDFGMFSTFAAYASVVTIFIGMGLPASIKKARYDHSDNLTSYINTQVILTVLSSLAFFGLLCVFKKYAVDFTGFSFFALCLMVIQSFGTSLVNIENSVLALNYEYKSYLAYSAFNVILNLGLSVLFILSILSENRLFGRILGSSIPLLLLGIFLLAKHIIEGEFKFNLSYAKYGLAFGFPLIWHYLAQHVQSQFDRIVITNLVGSSYTGIYSFAYSIAGIFPVIFYSTENVWSVWFFKQMNERKYQNIRETANKYLLLFTVLACGLIGVSREIILLVGPENYWEGEKVIIPIIFGMFFLYLYTLPVNIEYFYKETKYIAMTTGVSAVVNIITNLIFIKMYGYIAAAYTTALCYILNFILHWFISKRILAKNDTPGFFHYSDFNKFIIFTSVFSVLIYYLNPHPFSKYMILLCGGIFVFIKNKSEIIEFIDNNIRKHRNLTHR